MEIANSVETVQDGRIYIEAGDVADGCYRLEEGLLKVSIASPQGDERILAILGPGSIIGKLAIIDGLPRSAAVVAIRDCKLSFVSRGLRCARKRKSNPDRTEAARINRSIVRLLFHQRQAKASARGRRYRVS